MHADDYIPGSACRRGWRRNEKNNTNSLNRPRTPDVDADLERGPGEDGSFAAFRDSGLIIVGLQRTRMDPLAAVKIWGRLDDILPKLAEELMRPGGGLQPSGA